MKPLFLLSLALAVYCSSCDTTSVFESPNYLRRYPGKLFLLNGRSFEGRLSIEPGRPLAADVELYEEGDRHAMRFRLDEVKGYSVRGRYYELKERKGGLAFGRNFSFMSRLTPDSSQIQLYADIVNRKVSLNGGRSFINLWETDLYLQLPGDEAGDVYPLNGGRFSPSFHEKMSSLLEDCLALAQKISAKQEGYRLVTDRFQRNANTAVMLRIINEYNRCRN